MFVMFRRFRYHITVCEPERDTAGIRRRNPVSMSRNGR